MNTNTFDSKARPFNISKNVVSEKIRKLITYLELPISDRTNYQTHQNSLYLEEYSFFSKFASSGILDELMKHLKIENFPIGSIIIPWNATQSNFYLILTGRIGQFNRDTKGFEQIREYSSGNCFGESGLQNEMLKEEYRTLEPSKLMVLEKSIFEVTLSSTQKERFEEQYNFFKELSTLESLSDEAVSHLAKIALSKKFPQSTLIAKQGERPRGFYVIYSGIAKLLRNITIDDSGEKSSRIIEIEEAESGALICDYAFIHQEPLEYSVLCSMPITAYFFDKDYFRGENSRFLNELQLICSKIASDEELSERFKQKVSWKKFKNDFMNTLDIKKRKKVVVRMPNREKIKLPLIKRPRNFSVEMNKY